MDKYMGIVKIYEENTSGVNVKILSKTYNNEELLRLWFDLYPNSEHIILENNEELDSMFKIFKDVIPITDEEKEAQKRAGKIYEALFGDNELVDEMNALELTLSEFEVPKRSYTLLSERDQSMCLDYIDHSWITYFLEKGLKTSLKRHNSLYDACNCLLTSLSDSKEEAEIMKMFFKQTLDTYGFIDENNVTYKKEK